MWAAMRKMRNIHHPLRNGTHFYRDEFLLPRMLIVPAISEKERAGQ
jgi:hypothetical protein